MKRRNTVLVAALALLMGLVAYGTVAHFSGEAHVTNVITTGAIDIELKETKADGETEWENLEGVMPGQEIDKLVSVVNQKDSAWVRVKVETKVNDVVQNENTLVDINFNTTDWFEGEDNVWYYRAPLTEKGQETEKLFTTVTISPNMGNEYQGCDIKVDVTAQAVQSKNNDAGGTMKTLSIENYQLIKDSWPAWPAD